MVEESGPVVEEVSTPEHPVVEESQTVALAIEEPTSQEASVEIEPISESLEEEPSHIKAEEVDPRQTLESTEEISTAGSDVVPEEVLSNEDIKE
jgi:hypothetical protein